MKQGFTDQTSEFPKDFLWGASTSAHQVEGNNHNQWSVWELEHAAEFSKYEQRPTNAFMPSLDTLSIWPDIKDSVKDPANYVSGNGVEHFKRYKEDFRLVKELNLNALRFGIEWSRIEPEEGKWDEKAIQHYREYIAELRRLGIEPLMNIWHWTNPVWFEDMGAFAKRKNLRYFDRFVQKIAEELCDDVNYVITVNEANNYATLGYYSAVWPPQQKNPLAMLSVYYNLTLAHKRAHKTLKARKPALQVGVAHQATANLPADKKNYLDKLVAWSANYFWHNWFYNRIKNHQDFVGVNFYFVVYWKGLSIVSPKSPVSDLGGYMEPYGVSQLIVELHRKYQKPVIITENGVADMHDQYRKWWLDETMRGIADATKLGADIKGYFHWSLLDNFEWREGWWPKFGLIEVDRRTMKRTVRPSAKAWARKLEQLSHSSGQT